MTETEYKSFWDALIANARENSSARNIFGNYDEMYPKLQHITFDALDSDDWPNGINRNSIFLTFVADLETNKIWLHSFGHVWLTDKDKENPKYKYYAMCGMVDIAQDYGVKKFRKSTFKNADDLYSKLENYFVAVINALEKHTGGYPYKA